MNSTIQKVNDALTTIVLSALVAAITVFALCGLASALTFLVLLHSVVQGG